MGYTTATVVGHSAATVMGHSIATVVGHSTATGGGQSATTVGVRETRRLKRKKQATPRAVASFPALISCFYDFPSIEDPLAIMLPCALLSRHNSGF